MIDGLLRNGAEVIHSGVADVHATGHAQADELKTLLSITRPEYFVPIHGEYRHMVAHAKLAATMGVPSPNIVLVRGRRRHHAVRPGTGGDRAGARPATSTSTASSATSARACCGTAGCWPRRASSSSWPRSTSAPARCSPARRSSPAAGSTRPRPRRCSTRRATGWRRRWSGRSGNGIRDVEGLEREVRRAAGQFVSERTRRRPMIVPVVMEA